MSDFIIGVDPGDSTGVAVLKDGALLWVVQDDPETAATGVELVLSRLKDGDSAVLACERYVTLRSSRPHSSQPTAQRVFGVMEHLAKRYGVPFLSQGAADAWAIADNRALRALRLHQNARNVDKPDANDANMAIRHALLALARTRATVFDALLQAAD